MRRLTIVGCGDIGVRIAEKLKHKYRIFGLARRFNQAALLRSQGVVPIMGDLDDAKTLDRISGISEDVLHLAPPQPTGQCDNRTSNLIACLKKKCMLPQRLVYISTSGVYGDASGKVVSEIHRTMPNSDRAKRRLSAEKNLRKFGQDMGVSVSILRVPGIYSKDRLPIDRLLDETPMILKHQDSYTNHIHVVDLVNIIIATFNTGRIGRIYNVSDDSKLRIGDYFDVVAEHKGLKKPARISKEKARVKIPAQLFSFINESRIIDNSRMKRELGIILKYPTVEEGISH